MKNTHYTSILLASSLLWVPLSSEAKNSNWFVKPTFGISILSDQNSDINQVLGQSGSATINLDSGFNAGIGAGYFIDNNWALEVHWEYRSNDAETVLPNGVAFNEGNFASSIFAANAYYYFDAVSHWRWFAGAGLIVVQEIDIDLEDSMSERSYSGSGDLGFQIFTGVNYKLNEQWSAQTEIRYLNVSGIAMDAEENVTVGTFENIDYAPVSVQLSVKYQF